MTIKNTPKHSLLELAGILTHEEAEELRKHIKARRKASRLRMKKIAKLMSK